MPRRRKQNLKLYVLAKNFKNRAVKPRELKRNGYINQAIFLNNEDFVNKYISGVKNQTTIELHGHGSPVVYGFQEPDPKVDKSPFGLAEFFAKNIKDKNVSLTIDLRFCNSATVAKGHDGRNICFAQDFSKAMQSRGFNNITVYGYPAYLISNDGKGFKASGSSISNSQLDDIVEDALKQEKSVKIAKIARRNAEKKAARANLEECRRTYKNGELVQEATKVLIKKYKDEYNDLSDKDYKRYVVDKNLELTPNVSISNLSTDISDEKEDPNDNRGLDDYETYEDLIRGLKSQENIQPTNNIPPNLSFLNNINGLESNSKSNTKEAPLDPEETIETNTLD